MLTMDSVSLKYGDLTVLDDISFQVAQNEIVAIIGPSGCGKTSLLNIIAGLQSPTQGTVQVTGNKTAFIFQDDRILPWRTVWENIALVSDTTSPDTIKGLIQDVGLKGFEHYYPDTLSGGMKKRCGIARAFYYNSELLLMDEPFQGLDYMLRREMLEMVLQVWEKHRQGILFVTHEIDEALQIANRILVLSKRPTHILSEIQLPPYAERELQATTMSAIRQEIIQLLR